MFYLLIAIFSLYFARGIVSQATLAEQVWRLKIMERYDINLLFDTAPKYPDMRGSQSCRCLCSRIPSIQLDTHRQLSMGARIAVEWSRRGRKETSFRLAGRAGLYGTHSSVIHPTTIDWIMMISTDGAPPTVRGFEDATVIGYAGWLQNQCRIQIGCETLLRTSSNTLGTLKTSFRTNLVLIISSHTIHKMCTAAIHIPARPSSCTLVGLLFRWKGYHDVPPELACAPQFELHQLQHLNIIQGPGRRGVWEGKGTGVWLDYVYTNVCEPSGGNGKVGGSGDGGVSWKREFFNLRFLVTFTTHRHNLYSFWHFSSPYPNACVHRSSCFPWHQ